MLPQSVSALLGSVETPDLLDYIWERLWSARPKGRYGMRPKAPPAGQLVLPCARYLFRVPVSHKPTVRDLPALGWSPFAPGRWLDPETGLDRAEGLALIIERDRHGIEAEKFVPMEFSITGPSPEFVKRGPGRPRVEFPVRKRREAKPQVGADSVSEKCAVTLGASEAFAAKRVNGET